MDTQSAKIKALGLCRFAVKAADFLVPLFARGTGLGVEINQLRSPRNTWDISLSLTYYWIILRLNTLFPPISPLPMRF